VNHRRYPEHQAEQRGNGHASGPPQAEQHQQGRPPQNRVPPPQRGNAADPGQVPGSGCLRSASGPLSPGAAARDRPGAGRAP
jgi:hypothetical protein